MKNQKSKLEVAEPTPLEKSALPNNFKAVAVYCHNYLSSEVVELSVVDGVVVQVTPLAKSPDVAQITIGKASTALWQHLRSQKRKDYK
jgi:hypothetical protein